MLQRSWTETAIWTLICNESFLQLWYLWLLLGGQGPNSLERDPLLLKKDCDCSYRVIDTAGCTHRTSNYQEAALEALIILLLHKNTCPNFVLVLGILHSKTISIRIKFSSYLFFSPPHTKSQTLRLRSYPATIFMGLSLYHPKRRCATHWSPIPV